MKINVVHKDERFCIDILSTHKIWQIKEIISKALNLNLDFRFPSDAKEDNGTEKRNRRNFVLLYNAIILNDDCSASEVGLVSGSTLRCRHIQMSPYVLRIKVKFLSKDIEVRENISVENTTIGELRTYLQNKIGIPVSIFNLQQIYEKRVLFDNRLLSYYGIKYGDTLVLDVWKGTSQLLIAALNDDNSHTLSNVPSYHENPTLNRYYLKAALFIAAHHDFVNLAAQVLQRGARCDESVGEYPARQWCQQQSHAEVFKTPVHQAAMRGSFRILNVFLRYSPTCIVAKDGYARSPSIYASQNKHMECWKLLMVAQFQFQSICGFSLVIYSKILKWCNKARDRVLYFKGENKKQLLLRSQLFPSDQTVLGEPIIISGYHGIMSDDKERKKMNKLSPWSYNMNKSLENSSSIFALPQKGLERTQQNSLQSTNSEETKSLKSVQFKSLKDRPNTSSNLSSNSRSTRSSSLDRYKNRLAARETSAQNAHREAAEIIYKATGKTPAQIATKCFQMGQTFDRLKWRSQMNIALKCSLNYIDGSKEIT